MGAKRKTRQSYNPHQDNEKILQIPLGDFKLHKVSPLTDTQRDAFEAWQEGYNLVLHGTAGTGKTFLGLYFALNKILNEKGYRQLIIVRSAVASRDIGFMPGTERDKARVFEAPYQDIFTRLFGRGDAYEVLKKKGLVKFMLTSFSRGITLDNSIVLVDECQNMSQQELHTIMTRVGENTKIIYSGDVRQDDLTSERKREFSGLREFLKILDGMEEFDFIEFDRDDIVRSGIVRSYIIQKEELETNNS